MPNDGANRFIHSDDNSWSNDYISLNCPDKQTLAAFVGDPRICSSHKIDSENICIDGDPTGLGLDVGDLLHNFSKQSRPNANDIMFTNNTPSKLTKINLIRNWDTHGVSTSFQLTTTTARKSIMECLGLYILLQVAF